MKEETKERFFDCIHCGLCLSACPTYQELGTEMDSPRGRIYTMRALAEGRLQPEESTLRHLDLCLGCRACETACPSGVQYGQLLEASRADLAARRPLASRLVEHVFPYPGRTRLAMVLGMLSRPLASWMPGPLRTALELLPTHLPAAYVPPEVTPALGSRRYRVGLLQGCVASLLFGHVNRATIEVLARNGCEVVVPRDQGCCGALHAHNGASPAPFAERHDRAFAGLDAVITNAAGCGSAMKEHNPKLPVRDISEWLVDIGFEQPTRETRQRVTYQDACHLAHAQHIRKPPREILQSIPGLELIELFESDNCCGGAGVYNMLQPEMSERLLSRKVDAILASGAEVLAAANPGCLMQISRGLSRQGKTIRTCHPIELLAEAYEVPT
ncbi:MAG: (Fe-S)-binding protein [Candidatus Xenobia bacterium]